MKFKLIEKPRIALLYPNNYDYEKLTGYKLFDKEFTNNYQYCFSFYKYFLDKFINEKLNLEELDNKVKEYNPNDYEVYTLFKELNTIDTDYVYIRNNICLDRLNLEQYNKLAKSINDKKEEEIYSLVKETYKELVTFDTSLDSSEKVNYERKVDAINNALVIMVHVTEENEELLKFLTSKEKEYSKKLDLPVSIVMYIDEEYNQEVVQLKDLNEEKTKKEAEEMLKYKKYLPIGSVVKLRGTFKKVMIMGYLPVSMKDEKEKYDYIATLYPEGIIENDFNILFNHEDIRKVYAIGLIDEEQEMFMKDLSNDI